MPQAMDRTELAAYADGALDGADAADVALHLATHAGDRAWVAQLRASNAQLRAAYAEPMAEPAPDALVATILGAPRQAAVVPLRRKPAMRPWIGLALAAGVAAVALLGLGGREHPDLTPGPIAEAALAQSLDRLASGATAPVAGGEVAPMLSFHDATGRPCREFELRAPRITHAIACRDAGGWRIEAAVAQAPTEALESDFSPASGAGDDAIATTLDRLGAGVALDPEAEAALIAQGWPARR